jgi:hypothetical protein
MRNQEDLAREIVKALEEEFEDKHLAHNLIDTLVIERLNKNTCVIKISAPIYDQQKFVDEGIIQYTGEGSYADNLNRGGSWVLGKYIGNHIGYVEQAILKGIRNWQKSKNDKFIEVEVN